jgi:hypothetical protein
MVLESVFLGFGVIGFQRLASACLAQWGIWGIHHNELSHLLTILATLAILE